MSDDDNEILRTTATITIKLVITKTLLVNEIQNDTMENQTEIKRTNYYIYIFNVNRTFIACS